MFLLSIKNIFLIIFFVFLQLFFPNLFSFYGFYVSFDFILILLTIFVFQYSTHKIIYLSFYGSLVYSRDFVFSLYETDFIETGFDEASSMTTLAENRFGTRFLLWNRSQCALPNRFHGNRLRDGSRRKQVQSPVGQTY